METGEGSCCWTVVVGWLFLVEPVWKSAGVGLTGKQNQVCRQLGQEPDNQGAPMGVEWATSHV